MIRHVVSVTIFEKNQTFRILHVPIHRTFVLKLLVHLQAIIGGDRLEVILNHMTIASQIGHSEVKSVSFGDKNTPHGINVQTRRVFHMRVSHPSMPEVLLAENLAPEGR